MFKELDLNQLQMYPFKDISQKWMLVSASKEDKVNTMTASWGSMGTLWNESTVTIYVRASRYTKEFIDASQEFSLTFFDGYKKEMGLLGTKSGRDSDKIKEANLTIETIDGVPTFKEGSMVFICEKLYANILEPENFIDPAIVDKNYADQDYHTMYIGKVKKIYIKE